MNSPKNNAPVGLPEGLSARAAVRFEPATLREDDRSIEFILATEAPARVWSWERWEPITEVLVADGVVLPQNKQIPLQDSHDRSTVKSTLGSVRDIRIESEQVVGRLFFARSPEAVEAFDKIRDGHIDSGSVGYSVDDAVWIEKDAKLAHNGREYAGPMQLTRRWSLKEYSLVAIGADPNAKARTETIPETTSREAVDNISEGEITMEERTIDQPQTIDTEAIKREAAAAEQARAAKITELCAKHNMADKAAGFITKGASIESVKDFILSELERATVPVATANTIEIVTEAKDKARAAATDGLLLRSGIQVANPAPGAEQFRGLGFADIARELMAIEGLEAKRMSKEQLLQRALSTSEFPNVLANVANKAVMIGYQAAPSSWRKWARQGILPDFKSSYRVKLQDAPDMLEVIEGDEIQEGVVKDQGETIQLKTYARKLVITRPALINDDTGLFNTVFRAFGYRAANLVEATAYGILTGNANMADGYALFSTDHSNIATAGATVSTTTVNAGMVDIMEQTAPNGSKIGVMPEFLVVGPQNATAAALLCNSTFDTTSNGNANYNPFAFLKPIVSPHISAKKWFLICNPMAMDTVEVAFLDGRDTPTLYQRENDGDILGRTFVGYLDIGAKALEYRGMHYNAGS